MIIQKAFIAGYEYTEAVPATPTSLAVPAKELYHVVIWEGEASDPPGMRQVFSALIEAKNEGEFRAKWKASVPTDANIVVNEVERQIKRKERKEVRWLA